MNRGDFSKTEFLPLIINKSKIRLLLGNNEEVVGFVFDANDNIVCVGANKEIKDCPTLKFIPYNRIYYGEVFLEEHKIPIGFLGK
jgi:hypothetical protein